MGNVISHLTLTFLPTIYIPHLKYHTREVIEIKSAKKKNSPKKKIGQKTHIQKKSSK